MNKITKYLSIMLLPLLMACSSETDGPQPEDPDNKPNNEVVAEDVEPLPTMKSIDVSVDEKEVLNALMDISFKLNNSVAENYNNVFVEAENGNYCISPISVVSCLSLIANSLDNPAKEEMVKALGCSSVEELNVLNKKLLQYLPAPENGVDMRIANSVWYHNLFSVTDEYRQLMAENFGSPVYKRDFKDEGTIDEVNSWIDRSTNGMIKDLLTSIPRNCTIMWYNAIYFEGEWIKKFKAEDTVKANFNGSETKSIIDMMKKTEYIDYAEVSGLKMASIFFEGMKYSLDIILPTDEKEDVNNLLSAEAYQAMIDASRIHKVNLSLPKFKAESTALLTPVLNKMGMPHQHLHLTGIGFPEDYTAYELQIGQKAKFEVDEDGAKAAAVTGGMTTSTGEEPEYKEIDMVVDRPFFYIIRNHKTGALVMMGNVKNL